MKGIRLIELWANIKANIVAFLSIAMFVSLGVGLFLGIQWGAAALRNASLDTMQKGNMHDITVQFPYGITKSDIKKLKKVEGVTKVEPSYSYYVVMEDGNSNYTLKMQSLPQTINEFTSITGNLPMEHNEVALLKFWADTQGIVVGDTITLKHDASSKSDADGMDYFTSDTFEVTALVESPEYLQKKSAALGVSNINSGDIHCVGFVTDDAFDVSKFNDAYPNVYIRCESLDGLSVFGDEYKEAVSPIVDKITELGGTLGTVRYNKLHDEAQNELDTAQQKIDDAEQKLAEGQEKIDEGEKQLADGQEKIDEGEKQLIEGVAGGMGEQNVALTRLQDAYRQLADGQTRLDAAVEEYNRASQTYNLFNAKFESVRDTYDKLIAGHGIIKEHYGNLVAYQSAFKSSVAAYHESQTEEDWDNVQTAYANLLEEYQRTISDLDSLSGYLSVVGGQLNLLRFIGSLPQIGMDIRPQSVDRRVAEGQLLVDKLGTTINQIDNASVTVGDTTVWLTNIPAGMQEISDKLAAAKATIDASTAQLEAGWAEYNNGKSQYDIGVAEAQAKLQASEKELEDGKEQIKEKTQELEEGKQKLEENLEKLNRGKKKLQKALDDFSQMVKYEWVVLPRQANGSVQGLIMVSNMMDNVKWAMASLFVLVGLFVCYSAISRLVHEQIIQIGTKKALGFRGGEVTRSYLGFSGLSVLLGVVVSVAIAVLLVQGIMNPKAAKQFTIGAYGPYFGMPDVLAMGGVELLLILGSTWFAIHGLLKRQAIDLLKGESTANVKEHFYERTRLWQRMSLFSQTVVNNCVNDKRRVVGTLVGVIGCTALIVTAVTLSRNIALSFERHYEEVYSYDSVTYLSEESSKKADSVAMALYNRGVTSTPAYTRKLQMRSDDGTRSVTNLMVPTNEESFKKFYHVVSMDGSDAVVENGGLWVSAAYAEHQGAKPGDQITLTEFNGKTHTFTIAGFFDYYLLRYEFVLSQNEYRQAFGEKPEPNVLLTNLDGADIDRTRDALANVDGYSSLVDDRTAAEYAYDEINDVMNTVVLIYLMLSALMAVMVLLNLDIMFVDEKKRELIVLMINGFSAREAKAYIYRDSIVLTILGIALGDVLGSIIGGLTVYALQPTLGYWIKGFNSTAIIAGSVGAGVFATLVLLYALRRIPRFDLTDINRF